MKHAKLFIALLVFTFSLAGTFSAVHAYENVSQYVALEPGWNIVSTPKVLQSHVFSADETSENFDIYVLDASQSTGWATMADLGQSEFEPLYGYFINNKTGSVQTLTFNYDTSVEPNQKLFERTFSSTGWYSIGVANGEYAKTQSANTSDIDNPSKILSLLEGKYDLVIDFTDAVYNVNRKSVALSDPWTAVVPVDIDGLNDFRETKGYAIYIKETDTNYVGFQNDATSSMDKLVVKDSLSNPDSTTLQLETDAKSDLHTIFAFDLDTEDSTNDVEVTSIDVTVTVSSSTYDSLVDDAELVVNGVTLGDVTVANGSTSSAILTFTSVSPVVIGSGDRVGVNLNLRFNALSLEDEGTQVFAEMTTANVSTIEAESTGVITASGSSVGKAHTLRTAGIDVSPQSTGATVTSVDGSSNDYATFEIELEVTAVEQDVYIATDPAMSISYTLQDGAGSTTIVGTRSVILTSTADENGSYFEINEGETQNLTFRVTFSPETTNVSTRMVLNSISFAPIATAPTQTHLTLPATSYRTSVVTIVN